MDDENDLNICDCCGGLHEEVLDAGGHMQCVPCTKVANLEAENAGYKAQLDFYLPRSRAAHERIAELQAENERLREALEEAAILFEIAADGAVIDFNVFGKRMRAALEEQDDE